MVNKKQYTVISIFAGGGGSSLGYHLNGFKELLAIDCDSNSCETLRANFVFPVWEKDIKEITIKEILKFCKIKTGELDILDGSPPCQGFSLVRKRKINDERNDLFKEYIRFIVGLQPKVFIMENVPGMMRGIMKGKFNEILFSLKLLDYNVKVKLMNAMWYEVPQNRERLFFIGIRKDFNIEPSFPDPIKRVITVKEALQGCPMGLSDGEFTGERLELSLRIKPGGIGKNYDKESSRCLRKLAWNRPSATILKSVGKPKSSFGSGLIHPHFSRHLTIAELKRISSFPDDYKFIGKFREQWARIGNSVMPKMMYHIVKNIKINFLDKYSNKGRIHNYS